MARIGVFEGDRVAAVELCRRALAEAGDDLALRSQIEEGLAVAYCFMRQNLAAAAFHARSAVEAARQLDRPRALAEGLASQGLVDGLLARASARRHSRRHCSWRVRPRISASCAALLFFRRVSQLPHEAYAPAARALVDAHVGAAAGAERSAREALRLAPELGSYGGTTGRAALALLALSLERPNDAHDSLAPLVEH